MNDGTYTFTLQGQESIPFKGTISVTKAPEFKPYSQEFDVTSTTETKKVEIDIALDRNVITTTISTSLIDHATNKPVTDNA